MKSPEPGDALFALLLTAIFILVTTVFSKAQEVFSFRQLAIGFILTIAILAISATLGACRNNPDNFLLR